MDDIKLALLGNKEAAKRLTDAGVLLPCPGCRGEDTKHRAVMACVMIECLCGFKMAIAALRPVSREQVERVWPGCEACKDAGLAIGEVQFYGPFEGPIDVSGNMHYCPNCGRPITPVAKDRQGKRLETLKDEKSDL